MRHKIFAFASILVSGASALRDAVARGWQAMVRQTAAYWGPRRHRCADRRLLGHRPGLTCEQRTRAMEDAVRALITDSVQKEAAGGTCPVSRG